MEVLFAFVTGVAAAVVALKVIAWRQRPGDPGSPGEPPMAPEPVVEPSVPASAASEISPDDQLFLLSAALHQAADATSHPREVARYPAFKDAVEIFRTKMPLAVVLDYVGGRDWMLATAACSALSRRPDREDAVLHMRACFPQLPPWPVFFAFGFFKSLNEPPPAGLLIAQCPDWWADQPLITDSFADYFSFCAMRGIDPSSGGLLARLTQAEIASAEKLLQKITHPVATQLLDEIGGGAPRSPLDRAYLQTVGRLVEIDPDRAALIEHAAIRDQLAHAEAAIFQQPHRSLLVVGERGWGKTSFLSLLAVRAQRRGWTIFEAAGPQIQAGQVYIGELEERIRRLTVELDSSRRVLWYVPDFEQLATSGTHKGQSASLLDQLMPAITAGRLLLISQITPAELTRVLQQRPGLRTLLELVRLRKLEDEEAVALAREVAGRLAARDGLSLAPDTLDAAVHLSRHYLGTAEMPGSLIDLIKLAGKRAATRGDASLTREDVLTTVSQLTGMPRSVLDDRERVDLAALRTYFTSRVIGQTEAVEAVVDRIAMLKAGLTDPDKPVGVFLFAGPTGTGKTELAKTLASFLFGSPERLIRLDMSEFQTAEAVRKIIGDAGTNAALTDLVRKQPFSVVLLDEFEKAHPNIWDLFLQVFDDGRLTDGNGSTVDFRHCIIVLTSNVGSTIKQDAGPGFVAQDQALSAERVRKAINQSFRPEFVNRLDRIIIFRALSRDDMRSIVTKELAQVLERRGLRNREWAVEWESSALDFLLDKGFSPAMGARPLKRAIDEHLLAPLAATLVEHRFPEGDQFLFVRSDGRSLQVEFVDPDAPPADDTAAGADPAAAAPTATLPHMMIHPAGSAAEATALFEEVRRHEAEIAGERWTSTVTDLASRMERPDFWNQPDRQAIFSRFEVMDRVKAALATASGLAKRLERSADSSGRYSRDLIARLASQLFVVGHGIEDALADLPVEIVLSIQPVLDRTAGAAAGAQWCERLLAMYRAWTAVRGMRVDEITAAGAARPLLVISGFGVSRLVERETGLHVLETEESRDSGRIVARVVAAATPAVLPASPAEQRAALTALIDRAVVPPTVVRRYMLEPSPMVRDLRHGWRTGRADLVFSGHFDLMGELAPAAQGRE